MSPQQSRIITIAVALLACGLCMGAETETAQPVPPYVGEIIAESVYVRSGPSTNFYVVTKLNAGDRVTVMDHEKGVDADGEQTAWLAIVPPKDCFSLIARRYVDRDRDESRGIVNGDRVNIRVGSAVSEQKYAVQRQLSRGAEVKIVGEHDDEFLRIEPPEGALLWISGRYVQSVPDGLLKLEAETTERPAAEGEIPAPKPVAETGDIKSTVPLRKVTAPATSAEWEKQATAHRAELTRLEAQLKEEMAKPMFTRDLMPLAQSFQTLAEQSHDEYTRYYAQTRVAQLEDLATTISAVQRAYELRGGIAEVRNRYAASREKIKTVRIREQEGLAAQGELRESAIYNSPLEPRRYRLIDPALDVTRTVCYVEIPRGSNIDVNRFLGRKVGVRAKAKYLRTDSIDPVPIVVADELVLLEDLGETPPEGAAPDETAETPQPGGGP